MIDSNNSIVKRHGREVCNSSHLRITLIIIMVFSVSMPAIVVADEQPLPGNRVSDNAVSATESPSPDDGVPGNDMPSKTLSDVDDEVESQDDTSGTAPQPAAPNDPANDIPEVEDEVDPTDDRVETAPPPAAPDVSGETTPVDTEEADSTNGTVERAPPMESGDLPGETDPVTEETTEPTAETTEEPVSTTAPTPLSTPEPTETPTPSPTPSPTPEPAIPFEPEMTCVDSPGSQSPIAGDTAWAYLDCTASWETKDVSSASLVPITAPVGWQIVPLNDRTIQNPDIMVLNPKPLDLIDGNLADDEFVSSKFHLAMRVSCIDPTSVTVPLTFKATSGEDALQETSTVKHPFSATAATLPEVTLTSAVFEDVSPPEGTGVSTGVITMDYSNASENCGWKITTNIDDFVADDDVLSADTLTLVDVVGPAGLASSIENGEVTLYAAPGVSMPASGSITINVSMPVPETVSSGIYSTTITADAGAP